LRVCGSSRRHTKNQSDRFHWEDSSFCGQNPRVNPQTSIKDRRTCAVHARLSGRLGMAVFSGFALAGVYQARSLRSLPSRNRVANACLIPIA
jgi:hypothetical protein